MPSNKSFLVLCKTTLLSLFFLCFLSFIFKGSVPKETVSYGNSSQHFRRSWLDRKDRNCYLFRESCKSNHIHQKTRLLLLFCLFICFFFLQTERVVTGNQERRHITLKQYFDHRKLIITMLFAVVTEEFFNPLGVKDNNT